jgi:hypothetical protein
MYHLERYYRPELSQNEFVTSPEHIEFLSAKYDIPTPDVLMMALNLSGIKTDAIPENRVRFNFMLNGWSKPFFLALCVNTRRSPFELRDSKIFFSGEEIGRVFGLERDACDNSYFRRHNTSLTLNSNARSTCKGCAMCGTYSQDVDDLYTLSNVQRLSSHLQDIFARNNIRDASQLVQTTICTGCFGSEKETLDHILMVNKVLRRFGFSGVLRYIGSEINSSEALDKIAEEVESFALSVTTEVFTRRQQLLKLHKAQLNLDETKRLLFEASQRGFKTNILYVLGLDPLEAVEEEFRKLSGVITEFPTINLMQNYLPGQERLRDPSARTIDYYLLARQRLEEIFLPTPLRPNLWENYRPLWYTTFAGEPIYE